MSYLLLLYVTLEQEEAIKSLFHQNGWQLIKSDVASGQSGQPPENAVETLAKTSVPGSGNARADASQLPGNAVKTLAKTSYQGRVNDRANASQLPGNAVETLAKTSYPGIAYAGNGFDEDTSDTRHVKDEFDSEEKEQCEGQTVLVHCIEEPETQESSPRKNLTRLTCNERLSYKSNSIRGKVPVECEETHKLVADEDTEDLSENLLTGETLGEWFNNSQEYHHDNTQDINCSNENDSELSEDRNNSSSLDTGKHKADMRKAIRLKIERGKQSFLEKKRKQKRRKEKQVDNATENGKTKPERIDTHKKEGKKRSVYCEECKTTFTSQKRFEGHREKNGGQCVFTCEYCGKVFLYRKSKYLIHIRSAHTKERPFVCDICNKGYVTSDKLKIHKRSHTGERPCICEQCGKSFYSRAELSIHRDYHHNSRENLEDFVCNKCNITFCSKRYLIYHKNVTHSNSREYNCTKCEKRFKCNTALQRHVKYIHSESRNFKCNMCEKSFKTPTCLKKHVVRHGGEKGFYCSYCDKGFYEKAKLVQHVRIHTGEKPYRCDLCDYRCALSGNLSKHRKTHYKSL